MEGDDLVWFVEQWAAEGVISETRFPTEREAHAERRRLLGIEEETD